MNRNKRLYRQVMGGLFVFLLAPMEDGCKYGHVGAASVNVVAVRVANPFAPQTSKASPK